MSDTLTHAEIQAIRDELLGAGIEATETALMQAAYSRGRISVEEHHTVAELYEHRYILFLALISRLPSKVRVWMSRVHNDGTSYEGYFLLTACLPQVGDVGYHLPDRFWDVAQQMSGVEVLEQGAPWDGYTADDCLKRLLSYAGLLAPVALDTPADQ